MLSGNFFLMMMSLTSMLFISLSNPLGLAMCLILLSICVVFYISVMMSSWYAYMVFMIFIGGLLVMFIYICMITSNYSLSLMYSNSMAVFSLLLMLTNFYFVDTFKFHLGVISGFSANDFPINLFLGLGCLLLVVFIAMIQTVFCGGVTLNIEIT